MSVPKIIYSFAIVYSTVPKKSKQLFFYEWVILTDAVIICRNISSKARYVGKKADVGWFKSMHKAYAITNES